MEYTNILPQQELCKDLSFTGQNQMPKVQTYLGELPKEVIAFNRARASRKEMDAFIHFYVADRYFNCIWNRPPQYLSLYKLYTGVIGTDFSVYADMTKPEVMWNSFRNKVIAAWLQKQGIKVIPNVSWSKEWSYDFCFEGFPQHSIISVNSTGIGKDKFAKTLWIKGYEKALEVLEPVHIIRYGAKQDGEIESISTYYPNDNFKSAGYGW